jgi:hypothetical protein
LYNTPSLHKHTLSLSSSLRECFLVIVHAQGLAQALLFDVQAQVVVPSLPFVAVAYLSFVRWLPVVARAHQVITFGLQWHPSVSRQLAAQ